MTLENLAIFHCDRFNLDMPADRQREFCAKRQRKEDFGCVDCEHGIAAARDGAAEVPQRG